MSEIDPLTEIEYRAEYLLGYPEVTREELIEELDGIREAAGREREARKRLSAQVERILHLAELVENRARFHLPWLRPRLRLIRGGGSG